MRRRELIAAWPLWHAPASGAIEPATPRRTKTLHTAFRSPETTLDPAQTQSDNNTATILAHILEAPLAFDYLARPVKLVPATAAALPEVSGDGRRFRIRLQQAIYFDDDAAFRGKRRELVAADYVYAIKRFYDPKYNSSDLYIYESAKLPGLSELRRRALQDRSAFDYDTDVDGARVLDRYTFEIVLGAPDPRFIYRFADPATCGAVAREVVEFYGDDIGAHPVGTGPFRLKNWRRASRITLERSPTYRREQYSGEPGDDALAQRIAAGLNGKTLPLVDEVVVDIVEEAQPRWLSFVNGQYHFLEVPKEYRQLAAPQGRLAPFLAKHGVRLQSALQPDIGMSFFFMEHPLVGGYSAEKVALRRAIALAFDGRAYIQHVLSGFGQLASSTIPPFTSGYDAAYKSEMSDHDPARARALLDLYGYVDRDGDGWREQPDGSPLMLRRASTSALADRRANELWKRSMDAVNLRIEFEISTWPELLKKSRAGALMIWGYAWTAGSPDGGFFLSIAYGPNATEVNDPRFSLPEFDRLFEKQRALPDGPERDAVMHEAKNMLVAYMPFKVHVHNVELDLVQPWTHGYWRHPFMRDIWRFVDVESAA